MKLPPHTQVNTIASPLGRIRLAAIGQHLAGAWFEEGQVDCPDLSGYQQAPTHPILQQTEQQLAEYFDGRRVVFDLPLDLSTGTAFQQAVWQALLGIAYGRTCSYKAVSLAIGRPNAMRAVGAAVGRNPVSVIVPCHRVIGANGALTGYSGGMERKVALLKLESTH